MHSHSSVFQDDPALWAYVDKTLLGGVWAILAQGPIETFLFELHALGCQALVLHRASSGDVLVLEEHRHRPEFLTLMQDYPYRNTYYHQDGWYVYCLENLCLRGWPEPKGFRAELRLGTEKFPRFLGGDGIEKESWMSLE